MGLSDRAEVCSAPGVWLRGDWLLGCERAIALPALLGAGMNRDGPALYAVAAHGIDPGAAGEYRSGR